MRRLLVTEMFSRQFDIETEMTDRGIKLQLSPPNIEMLSEGIGVISYSSLIPCSTPLGVIDTSHSGVP